MNIELYLYTYTYHIHIFSAKLLYLNRKHVITLVYKVIILQFWGDHEEWNAPV